MSRIALKEIAEKYVASIPGVAIFKEAAEHHRECERKAIEAALWEMIVVHLDWKTLPHTFSRGTLRHQRISEECAKVTCDGGDNLMPCTASAIRSLAKQERPK